MDLNAEVENQSLFLWQSWQVSTFVVIMNLAPLAMFLDFVTFYLVSPFQSNVLYSTSLLICLGVNS